MPSLSVVTVAVRRERLFDREGRNLLDFLDPKRYTILPNTAGCFTAEDALRWSDECRSAGVWVGCFRPPSVPDGISRLRLTARADLTDADVDRAVEVITRCAPAGAS